MKQLTFIKQCIIAIILGGMSQFSWAEGFHNLGVVGVNDLGSVITFSGPYNVRYNPNVSGGSINVIQYSTGNIQISAYDSNTNAGVACSIQSTDAIYPLAEKILATAGNGAVVSGIVSKTTNKCTSLNVSKSSNFLD